jgi:hypothetical protein
VVDVVFPVEKLGDAVVLADPECLLKGDNVGAQLTEAVAEHGATARPVSAAAPQVQCQDPDHPRMMAVPSERCGL